MVGVVAIGDTPEAEHATKALEQLNLMVKTWGANPDPKLWQLTEGSVTLIDATETYVLTAARKVMSARRRIGTGTSQNDMPLNVISRQEYYDKPAKLSTGYPLDVYFDPQRATRTLYVWPVPDATIASTVTIPYTYLRVIEDLDSLDDDFDLPQEWLEVLEVSLAARLIIPFRVHITDPAGAQLIMQRAQDLYAQLSSYDEEDASVFLQPSL